VPPSEACPAISREPVRDEHHQKRAHRDRDVIELDGQELGQRSGQGPKPVHDECCPPRHVGWNELAANPEDHGSDDEERRQPSGEPIDQATQALLPHPPPGEADDGPDLAKLGDRVDRGGDE